MDYSYQVSVHFQEWSTKERDRRELARRKKMRQRIARKFAEYHPKLDDYHVMFARAPADLGARIKKYVGKVLRLYIVREKCAPAKPARPPRQRKAAGKPKPAVMSATQVRAALRERGFLTCTLEGGRGETVELEVEHRSRRGATSADIEAAEKALNHPLSPSHRRLLEITDGCALLADAAQRSDTGLVIYSARQLIRENKLYEKSLDAGSSHASDQIVVGEPVGMGNSLGVNYARTSKLGEAPIIFIDHEGGDADGRTVADSFEDLLKKLGADPLAVLKRSLDGSVLYLSPGKRRVALEPRSYRRGFSRPRNL